MTKLVVNIKGQSEVFGLTDDVRDIGGNDYLTVSNGNKKQYARLGNHVTKLILRKNNQKFYVQKDPTFFENKTFSVVEKTHAFDIYLPIGKYFIVPGNKEVIVSKSDFYKVILKLWNSPYTYNVEIKNDTDRILHDWRVAISKHNFTISRSNKID